MVRRFVTPSLLSAAVTDVGAMFRLMLQTFSILWENYRPHLMVRARTRHLCSYRPQLQPHQIELGVILDNLFIGLLESAHSTPDQKKDILDVFFYIFGPAPVRFAC